MTNTDTRTDSSCEEPFTIQNIFPCLRIKQKYIDPFPQITLTSLTKPQN